MIIPSCFVSYFLSIFMSEFPSLGQSCCLLLECLCSSYSFSQRHKDLHRMYPDKYLHYNLICLRFGWQHRPVLKPETAVLATFSLSACQTSLRCGEVITRFQLDPETYKRSNPSCSKVWQTAHTRSVCVLQCWIFLLLWKCNTELKFFLTSCFLLCLINGLEEKKTQICSDRYLFSRIL